LRQIVIYNITLFRALSQGVYKTLQKIYNISEIKRSSASPVCARGYIRKDKFYQLRR